MAGLRAGFTDPINNPNSLVMRLSGLLRFVYINKERTKLTSADLIIKPEADSGKLTLSNLPRLPARTQGYYTEPLYGALLVFGLCATLLQMVLGIADFEALSGSRAMEIASLLIWGFASAAVACTVYLIFGHAGEIKRSASTCYPIPDCVNDLLLASQPPAELAQNVAGPNGTSYCVRCLVWRPEKAHHCSVCNRCVVGFDHHCSTFGRCIVRDNMPCFVTLYAMLLAGSATMVFAFALYALAPEPPGLILRTMPIKPL